MLIVPVFRCCYGDHQNGEGSELRGKTWKTMAKKTATEKTEKGEKSASSTEKSSGDKTPAEPAKCESNEQPIALGW